MPTRNDFNMSRCRDAQTDSCDSLRAGILCAVLVVEHLCCEGTPGRVLRRLRASVPVAVVFLAAGCSSATTAAPKSSSAPTTASVARSTTSWARTESSTSTARTSTSELGPDPEMRAYDVLEASLQAARDLIPPPPDYRRLTAAALGDRVAVATFGPISSAGRDVVGFSAESPSRVLFVVELERGGPWDCVAVDDGSAAITNPTFGHAQSRDAIATYEGCLQHR
jgi:hypothetical protein